VENVDTRKTEERKDLQAAVEHGPEVTGEANGLDRSLVDDGSARNVSQNTEEETNQGLLVDVEEAEVDNEPRRAVSDMIDSDAEGSDSEEDPQVEPFGSPHDVRVVKSESRWRSQILQTSRCNKAASH